MNDLISVIVPVYNVSYYLKTCLNSILMQTYTNLEIILVDDGSTDKSGAICDEYGKRDTRVRVVHQVNGGVSTARNTGLDIAKGNFICFADGDDILPHNSIQAMYDEICKTQAQYCQGAVYCILPRKNSLYNRLPTKVVNRNDQDRWREYVLSLNWGPWGALFQSDIISREKLRFMTDVKIYEDSIFLARYLNICDHVCATDENVYYYNWLNNNFSATRGGGYEDLWRWSDIFSKETAHLFKEDYDMRNSAIEELALRDLHFVLTYYGTRSEYFGEDKTLKLIEQTCKSMLPSLNNFCTDDLLLPLSQKKCERYRDLVLSGNYAALLALTQPEKEPALTKYLRQHLARTKRFLLYRARIINLD